MTLVLWDARVYDPATGSATERQAVTIEEDTIVAVEDAEGQPPPGAHDLGGATVLPGLIDAHAHIQADTSRSPGFGPPPARHGDPPRHAALDHYVLAATADRMLRSGFTTVRDVGGYDDAVFALRQAIDARLIPGPRVYTCGRIVSASGPGGAIFGSMYRQADGPWEMRKAVREQIRNGAEFIKFMATGARSVVLEDPEPAQMTIDEMSAIVDEAHRMGRRVAAHAEGLEGTRLALEAGTDTIEHGLSLHREPRLLEAMADRGTVLVPTLSTFHDLAERFVDDFPQVLVDQAKRQLDEANRTVARAREAGVTMALGYDSGPPGSSANELLRLIEAGLSTADALRAATLGGAAALGRDDLGRIGVGCRADLVVVDGRPDDEPVVLTRPEAIRLVVGRGVAFGRGGALDRGLASA